MELRRHADSRRDQQQSFADEYSSAGPHRHPRCHQSLRQPGQQRRVNRPRHHCAAHHLERQQSANHRAWRRFHRSRRNRRRYLREFGVRYRQRRGQHRRGRDQHRRLHRRRRKRKHQHRAAHRHRARHDAAGHFMELHQSGVDGGHQLRSADAGRDRNQLYFGHRFVWPADDHSNPDQPSAFAPGNQSCGHHRQRCLQQCC